MQVGAEHIALHAALGRAVRQVAKGCALLLYRCTAGVDLVAGEFRPCKGGGGCGCGLSAAFFVGENRPGRQQAQAAQSLGMAALGASGIIQRFPQHLVAAADAQHRRAARRQLLHSGFQPGLPQPEQVVHSVFGAGQNHQVRRAQLPRGLHVAHAQQGVLFQRHKIGKVGDMGQA